MVDLKSIEATIYECPRCLYTAKQKSHMKCHFNRKTLCKLHKHGVSLTALITQEVLDNSYVVTRHQNKFTQPSKESACNTIYQTIINQQCNIFTNGDIVSTILPFVERLKYGQTTVFDRLDKFQELMYTDNDGSDGMNHAPTFNIDKTSVFNMTNNVTQTCDTHKFSDAYYGFDQINKNYLKRSDEHIWKWNQCTIKEIMDDIVEQLFEYVFKPYEIKLNNAYLIETNPDKQQEIKQQLVEFYKINKYLLIKALCCTATHDNEILFYELDSQYNNNTGTDLCKELKDLFESTMIDPWEMMGFREEIERLIQSNGKTTFNMIKTLVYDVIQKKT